MTKKIQAYYKLKTSVDEIIRLSRNGQTDTDTLLETIETLLHLLGIALGVKKDGGDKGMLN